MYVGKSLNVKNRLNSHLQSKNIKTEKMVKQAVKIEAIPVLSELEALLLEADCIRKYQPKYNISLKDDKHPLYIKITKEEYPRIYTSRRLEDKAYYFGPFPSSTIVKQVLKNIRKIFPY